MTSKKINQTLFRIKKNNTYDNLSKKNLNEQFINLIVNKLNYLNINTFSYYTYHNKINLLIWVNHTEKIYTYLKKKSKKTNNSIILKKRKRKITLPNPQNNYKINKFKLILIKNLVNKFFFNKYKLNLIDCQKLNIYCENFLKDKQTKALNLTKNYLKVLKFPLSTKRIKKSRKNILLFQLIFAGLLSDSQTIAKIIKNAMEKNRNQKSILTLIEFIVSKIFLVTMNFKGILIQINGKFLKKFGNKKIRATKQQIIIGQHIPKQSINKNISYGFAEAKTYLGVLSIHVWIKN